MTICFLFKNGKEVRMKCEKFTTKVDKLTHQLTGYEFEGATENPLSWVDFSEISCIYRVFSDEKGDAGENA